MSAALSGRGGIDGGDLGIWALAGVAALGLHAALAAWALRTPPIAASDPSAAAAVMIELAPEPVAPEATETLIAPDVVDQREVLEAPDEIPDLPDPLVEEMATPEEMPLPEVAAPLEDVLPPVDMTPVEMAAVAVERPLARPERPKPVEKAPERVERKPPPEKEPPQVQRRAAAAEAPPAPVAAAAQNSRGSAGNMTPATWKSRLMARLERAKRYPSGAQRRREEGVAHVSFSLDASGRVTAVQLARSSGYPELDAEVLALVRRASPLPPPPAGVPGTITAPVKFNLR